MEALGNAVPAVVIQQAENQEDAFDKVLAPFQEHLRCNVASAKDADLFIIGERHQDPEIEQIERDLIHYLASQGPVIILEEGNDSEYIWPEELVMEAYGDQFLHNIKVTGWDLSTEEILQKLGRPQYAIDKEIERLQARIDSLMQEKVGYEERISQIAPGLISEKGLDEELLNKLHERELNQVAYLLDCITMTNNFLTQRTDKLRECYQSPVATDERIRAAFPDRTRSMVRTLQNIDEIKRRLGMENAKVVLITGKEHVITRRDRQHDPNYDVTDLYREMDHHRCVSLIPATIWPED